MGPAAAPYLGESAFGEGRARRWLEGREREQDLRCGSRRHRQGGSDRNGVAQPVPEVGSSDADPMVALGPVQLRALTGDVPQPRQYRRRAFEQGVGPAGRQSRPWSPAAVTLASQEPMDFKGNRQSMRGRTRQPGHLGEGRK